MSSKGGDELEKVSAKNSKNSDVSGKNSFNELVEKFKRFKIEIPHRVPECDFDELVTRVVVKKYDGEVFNGLFHGKGKAEIYGGHYYEGDFQEGFMHGKGMYIWCDGLKYEGDLTSNIMTGKGKFSWLDGSIYEGDVVNGGRHGWGVFYHRDRGIKYEGQWYQGKQHGKGKMMFCDKGLSYYDGYWADNKKSGWGRRLYVSGNVYEGEWKDNLRHGRGTMRWTNIGEEYSGEWKCGLQDGEGVHTWYVKRSQLSHYQRRNTYRGCFRVGKRNGWGVFHYANGSRYEGQWCNNLKSGQGKLVLKDGRVFEGEFVRDRIKEPSSSGRESNDLGDVRTRTPQTSNPSQDPLGFTLKLDHLFTGLMSGSKEEEVEQVVKAILRYSIFLRSIYFFYCRVGVDDSICDNPDNVKSLKQVQFWRLLKDCRFQNFCKMGLPPYDRMTEVAMEPMGGIYPLSEVFYEDFLTRLITISFRLFSSEFKDTFILSACFTKLLLHFILKHSCQVRGYIFCLPKRSLLVMKYVDPLFKMFQCLCTSLDNKQQRSKDSITMRQFLILMKDLNLINDTLTTANIIEVMSHDDTKVTLSETAHCLEHEMGFYDFLEALVGCCLVRTYPICVCNITCEDVEKCQTKNFNESKDEKEEGAIKKEEEEGPRAEPASKVPEKEQKGGDDDAIALDDPTGEEEEEERRIGMRCIGCMEEVFCLKFQRFVVEDFMGAARKYIANSRSKGVS